MGRAVRVGALVVTLVTAAGPAAAQTRRCDVPPFHGTASAHGVVATMTVVNDGQPCGTSVHGFPDERGHSVTHGVVTQAPRNGRAEFLGQRVQYTPHPGYVGEDEFAYEASAAGPSGRPVVARVRMRVTVRPAR